MYSKICFILYSNKSDIVKGVSSYAKHTSQNFVCYILHKTLLALCMYKNCTQYDFIRG